MRATILAVLLLVAAPLRAQDLASRIAASRGDGITFTFEGKEGVCGDGEDFNFGGVHQSRGGARDCEEGPVRVTLQMNGRRIMRIRTTVGGSAPRGADDLGPVAAAEAANWLLDLAERDEGRASEEALMPAAVARDVVVWPRLATMARQRSLRDGIRKQAIFWLGQQAADQAVGPLEEVLRDDPEREIQQMALFALMQQHSDRAIDILVRTARTHPDQEVRRTAFFWLGQSEDPRGIALFEEVLAGR